MAPPSPGKCLAQVAAPPARAPATYAAARRLASAGSLEKLRSPVYIGFHALSLAAVCFVAVRLFSLFPKAQPPRIGPAKPPPAPILLGMLYAAWLGVTVGLGAILAGWIF